TMLRIAGRTMRPGIRGHPSRRGPAPAPPDEGLARAIGAGDGVAAERRDLGGPHALGHARQTRFFQLLVDPLSRLVCPADHGEPTQYPCECEQRWHRTILVVTWSRPRLLLSPIAASPAIGSLRDQIPRPDLGIRPRIGPKSPWFPAPRSGRPAAPGYRQARRAIPPPAPCGRTGRTACRWPGRSPASAPSRHSARAAWRGDRQYRRQVRAPRIFRPPNIRR